MPSLRSTWAATSFQLERLQASVACIDEEEANFATRNAPPQKLT